MSDQAHFHLSGFVNKQNFLFLVCQKPLRTSWDTTSQDQSHSTVRDIFIWNYRSFFEDERGERKVVTVTWPRYVHILENVLGPELASHPGTEETFCQHDGATSHTARESMAAVRNLFPNRVISRYVDVTWPARSPDPSACDFFLWRYLKSRVFKAPAPRAVQGLKHRIQQEVKRIPVEMLQTAMGDVRRVPRAERRLSELCYFWVVGLLFLVC
jgi:hypothetical protein